MREAMEKRGAVEHAILHRDRGLLCSGIGRGSIVGRAAVEGVPQIRGCVKSTLNFTVTRRYRVPANRSMERSRPKKGER